MALNFASLHDENVLRQDELMKAVISADIPQVMQLPSLGASIEEKYYETRPSYTFPLTVAVEKNLHEMVKFLIEVGADVDAQDHSGVTALHMAAHNGNLLCLKELINAEANSNLRTNCSKLHSNSNWCTGGLTPLHAATMCNEIICVIELIQSGADYNVVNGRGRTSLYMAAEYGFWDCVMAHLKNAIGKVILSLPSFYMGYTPLHFAVKSGMTECIQELLHHGSDPYHLDSINLSPFDYALQYFNSDYEERAESILKLLVFYGYNVNLDRKDSEGYTLLHYVAFNSGRSFFRRPKLASFLISHGANPLIKNTHGHTIIECEMRDLKNDMRILNAIEGSLLHLPPLESLKVPLNSAVANPTCRMWLWNLEKLADRCIKYDVDENNEVFVEVKVQWYKSISSLPRTLKHYSKYKVREMLGPSRIQYVHKLPLPQILQCYLLLE